jgi:TRAP-type C4-dicarboxylate transport system substrate-binding protein
VLGVWAKKVEAATAGRVKFEMLPKHPSAAPGTFDVVRDSLVDVSFVTASYTPARHPLPLMAELPGAGGTAEINSVAFSRMHWKYFQPANEYKGVTLLGVFTHGAGQMFSVKKPVNSVAAADEALALPRRLTAGRSQNTGCPVISDGSQVENTVT